MTDSGTPIRSNPARFRVGGTGRGQGIVLLYPDKLAAVNSSARLWGAVIGSIVFAAVSYRLFHDAAGLALAVGIPVGDWIGASIGKGLAAGTVAADGDGVRLIPLDSITSVRFRNSAGIGAWLFGQALLVTTVDGAEYEFRGMLNGWQAALADTLTVRGRDVQVTPQGITVTSQALPGTG
jgi:hypothetical protein